MSTKPSPPIRVLFVIHTLESGGAERQLVECLHALPREEFECRVACLVRGGFYEDRVRACGAEISVLGYRPMRRRDGSVDWSAAATLPGARAKLRGIIRDFRPDVLQSMLIMSDFVCASLAGERGDSMRFVASARNVVASAPMGALRKRMLGWALRRADAVLCNARVVADDVVREFGVDPSRARVVYNGVDVDLGIGPETPPAERRAALVKTRAALGFSPETFVIGNLAQFRRQKDHPTLVRAFAELHATASPPERPLALLLVGDGPERPRIEALTADLGIAGRVKFTGVREDVGRLLGAMDLYVQSSFFEGLPNAVLEAMAAAKPIVATRVGGTAEALDDGRCGLLVAPGDVGGMTAAMRRLMDSQTAAAFSEAARERVRAVFSREALARELPQLYRDVLARS